MNKKKKQAYNTFVPMIFNGTTLRQVFISTCLFLFKMLAFLIRQIYNNNMKIKVLVVSNSNGNLGPMLSAIDREKPDVIIHLGGGVRDLADINFSGKIYAVRSGSEFGKKLPTMNKLSFDKQIILYTHGDGLSIRKDKADIVHTAVMQGATIMLFGNSEEPVYFEQDNIKFVAPGSIADRKKATYAVIILDTDNEPQIEHKKVME